MMKNDKKAKFKYGLTFFFIFIYNCFKVGHNFLSKMREFIMIKRLILKKKLLILGSFGLLFSFEWALLAMEEKTSKEYAEINHKTFFYDICNYCDLNKPMNELLRFIPGPLTDILSYLELKDIKNIALANSLFDEICRKFFKKYDEYKKNSKEPVFAKLFAEARKGDDLYFNSIVQDIDFLKERNETIKLAFEKLILATVNLRKVFLYATEQKANSKTIQKLKKQLKKIRKVQKNGTQRFLEGWLRKIDTNYEKRDKIGAKLVGAKYIEWYRTWSCYNHCLMDIEFSWCCAMGFTNAVKYMATNDKSKKYIEGDISSPLSFDFGLCDSNVYQQMDIAAQEGNLALIKCLCENFDLKSDFVWNKTIDIISDRGGLDCKPVISKKIFKQFLNACEVQSIMSRIDLIFYYALQNRKFHVVEYLFQNLRTKNEITMCMKIYVLIWSMMRGRKRTLEILLKLGEYPDSVLRALRDIIFTLLKTQQSLAFVALVVFVVWWLNYRRE